MIKFSRLLYEAEEEAPEAEADDVFGQYLFGLDRKNTPPEPDTDKESEFKKALKSFFTDSSQYNKLDQFASEIIELLAQHKYEPLLDPKRRKVYRGLRVHEDFLKSLLEPYGTGIEYNKPVIINHPDVLVPKTGKILQSWSSSRDIAANFSNDVPYTTKNVGIVFVARTNAEGNQFFGKPGDLANVITQGEMSITRERETISVGPVEYDGFVYHALSSSQSHLFYVEKQKTIKDIAAALKEVH